MARLAYITFLSGSFDHIDNSLPDDGTGEPPPTVDNSLPGCGGGRPPHPWLPASPGRPVHLPVFPYDPTLPWPPPGNDAEIQMPHPEHPDRHPIDPNTRFKLKFLLACGGWVLVPDQTLPGTPAPK